MKKINTIQIALLSLIISALYGVYNGAIGLINGSWWFFVLAVYYIVLGAMRFGVLLSAKSSSEDKRFITRFVGILFVVMSVVLAGTTYLSILKERGVKHHEIVMITIALYSFVKITLAIINLVKARRGDSLIIKTLRNISFADALVSIFSLQRSMLVSFEGMQSGDILIFNALTGSAVYILVFVLGINLIGGKKVTMAKSKIVKANEKIAEGALDGYKKIEKGVVDGYKKIEKGVVDGYTKIEDKFVERYLTRDGESVEEAKQRLKKDQK